MASATAPIKIDPQTDELLTQAAHFLRTTKKDVVDAAIREYVEKHRDDISRGVREALNSLDGSVGSALSLLSGFSAQEIADLGGLPEQ